MIGARHCIPFAGQCSRGDGNVPELGTNETLSPPTHAIVQALSIDHCHHCFRLNQKSLIIQAPPPSPPPFKLSLALRELLLLVLTLPHARAPLVAAFNLAAFERPALPSPPTACLQTPASLCDLTPPPCHYLTPDRLPAWGCSSSRAAPHSPSIIITPHSCLLRL